MKEKFHELLKECASKIVAYDNYSSNKYWQVIPWYKSDISEGIDTISNEQWDLLPDCQIIRIIKIADKINLISQKQ